MKGMAKVRIASTRFLIFLKVTKKNVIFFIYIVWKVFIVIFLIH